MFLEFSRLKEEHIEKVVAIERLSFKDPWTRDMFRRECDISVSCFYVAFLGVELVGYCGYWQVADEAQIVNLAVNPDFRQKGIGRKILEYILSEISKKNCFSVLLEVRESNISAIKLYESAGFTRFGIRKKYYGSEDALMMKKDLRNIE